MNKSKITVSGFLEEEENKIEHLLKFKREDWY